MSFWIRLASGRAPTGTSPHRLEPQPNFPRPRPVKFRKVNRLPGSNLEPSLFQWPCQMISQHGGLHVRGRISLPVPVFPAFPRHRPLQGRGQVPPNVRVGPFLDSDGRRGMGDNNVEQSVPPAAPGGRLLQ